MADEEEGECCPLCMEELDLTDKTFDACPCGYQVCLWCWHQIKNEYNGLCPACRTPYSELSKQKATVDREDVVRRTKQRKQREKNDRRTASHTKHQSVNRKNLANVRVMQRNLVYVIGLPQHFADEETLKSDACFGQYGKIIKAVVNKAHLNTERTNATASAYVTFAHKEDAATCILAIDGFYLDGSMLRASFGTTKYCNFFLRNLVCNNPDCLYLHELGDQDDSFTKEEMQAGKAAFRDQTLNSPEVRSGSSFPPPEQSNSKQDKDTHTQDDSGSNATASDAQRKAQSAAAVYKLKQLSSTASTPTQSTSSSPSPSTSASAASKSSRRPDLSTCSPTPYANCLLNKSTSATSTPERQQHTVTPAASTSTNSRNPTPPKGKQQKEANNSTMKDRKPTNLTVDTTRENTSKDQADHGLLRPFEALKLSSAASCDEPAWARPFPSPSLAHSNENDQSEGNVNTDAVYSPFGMPFTAAIHSKSSPKAATASEPWSSNLMSSLGLEDGDEPKTVDPIDALVPPPSPSVDSTATSTTSSSSFASIDAIFSQRNESSAALAGLLGVQLSATPMAHGTLSGPTPRSASSSRFAFANQPSIHEPGAFPASQLGGLGADGLRMEMETSNAPAPFGYSGEHEGMLGQNNHSSTGYSPGVMYDSSNGSLPPMSGVETGVRPPPPSSAPSSSSSNSVSGLAFLQQMLPNVNISFGGEFPSSAPMEQPAPPRFGNPWNGEHHLQHSYVSSSSKQQAASNGFSSDSSRLGQSFCDPAIISHSSGSNADGPAFFQFLAPASVEEDSRRFASLANGLSN